MVSKTHRPVRNWSNEKGLIKYTAGSSIHLSTLLLLLRFNHSTFPRLATRFPHYCLPIRKRCCSISLSSSRSGWVGPKQWRCSAIAAVAAAVAFLTARALNSSWACLKSSPAASIDCAPTTNVFGNGVKYSVHLASIPQLHRGIQRRARAADV